MDSSLAEAQCYEIPVDSFETPQRIYVDGVRLSALTESLETPVREWSLAQDDVEIKIIDQTQYCPAREQTSVSTDVTGQRESMPSSVGPGIKPEFVHVKVKLIHNNLYQTAGNVVTNGTLFFNLLTSCQWFGISLTNF